MFLNGKFKIKKYCKDNIPAVLDVNRLKYKKIYSEINVIIKENSNTNYIISIADDYSSINLSKNDLYSVNYKLLYKCTVDAWDKNLSLNKDKNFDYNAIIDDYNILNEDEENL